jgi:hypothetical protein
MPLPLVKVAYAADPLPPDFGRQHRTEPVPPVPHHLVADDPALEQEIFDIRKLKAKRTYS